jgi:hypothetical protein
VISLRESLPVDAQCLRGCGLVAPVFAENARQENPIDCTVRLFASLLVIR